MSSIHISEKERKKIVRLIKRRNREAKNVSANKKPEDKGRVIPHGKGIKIEDLLQPPIPAELARFLKGRLGDVAVPEAKGDNEDLTGVQFLDLCVTFSDTIKNNETNESVIAAFKIPVNCPWNYEVRFTTPEGNKMPRDHPLQDRDIEILPPKLDTSKKG